MGFLGSIFNTVLYQPLFNGLVLLYGLLPGHDFGVAIIVLTIIIKLILYPLSKKAIQSQKALAKLQPQIKEVQQKYKDKSQQGQAMIELYKKHKINPMSGCLPLLIQIPVFFAMYRVFMSGLEPEKLNGLYSFVTRPENFNPFFLGLVNLSQPSVIMAVIAGILMFVQSKMTTSQMKSQSKKGLKIGGLDFSTMMGQQMTYVMPVIMVFLFSTLPAALALYLIVITLFGIIQQHFTRVGGLTKTETKETSGQQA